MSFLSFGRVKTAAMQTINGSTLPIAIDFGVSALKVIQLAAGDTPTLIAAACLDTPDALIYDHATRFQFQCQALPRLIKAGKFRGKRAACAIPAEHMYCKHLQLARADGAALEEQVKAAVSQAVNAHPDALALRSFPVEGGQATGSGSQSGSGVKQEVICLAASRELVQRIMNAVRSAKLEPVGIHPECIATMRAFDHINRRAGDEHLSTLYLDVGAGTTKVWITHGKSLVFAKIIQLGGRDLDQAVAHALDIRLAEARQRRLAATTLVAPARSVAEPVATASQSEGQLTASGRFLTTIGAGAPVAAPPSDTGLAEDRRVGQLAPGLTPDLHAQDAAPMPPPEFDLVVPLETLTDEVAMCLRYYESMFPGRRIDRAVFFGGESRHRALCQLIAKRVRATSHVADPVARIARTGKEPCLGVDLSTPQPGWTIAFGVSMCPTDL